MKLILASTSKFKSEILDKVGMKHSNMGGNYNEVLLDTNNVYEYVKELALGKAKNIDIKVENKFEALKEYSKKHKVNWAFVRDYDKNNCLYYCNTEYTDDMENENWNLIDKMF